MLVFASALTSRDLKPEALSLCKGTGGLCPSSGLTKRELKTCFIFSLAIYSLFPPRIISVPLPAILVAIVTAPFLPACATISDSLSTFSGLAFNKLCGIFSSSRSVLNNSLFSILVVPTSIGLPCLLINEVSFATARHLALSVLKT